MGVWVIRAMPELKRFYCFDCFPKGRHQNKKNVSIRALPEFGGGGLPLPEFFCALFLLKEKVSPMVATAERVGKVARIRGWGGFG